MSYISPLGGGIYKLPEPNSELRGKRMMLDDIDDPLFYAFQGVLILLAIALLTFLFWSVGSIVWTRPWANEIPSWPGLYTSAIWTLTGMLEGAAVGWSLWKFGLALRYLAKQKWGS